jgi:hypothetical protein
VSFQLKVDGVREMLEICHLEVMSSEWQDRLRIDGEVEALAVAVP